MAEKTHPSRPNSGRDAAGDMSSSCTRTSMSVALYIPTSYSLGNPASGALRLAQGLRQEIAAAGRVELSTVDPWSKNRSIDLDVVHAIGFDSNMASVLPNRAYGSVVHAIHDSLMPTWRYRLAVRAGLTVPRIDTIPAQKAKLYRAVDVVVAMSENERGRICESFGISPERVRVVHCAVGPRIDVPESRRLEVLQRLSLPPRFALALCDYGSPRKNILRLVQAVRPTGIPLVLAGYASRGTYLDRIRAEALGASNIAIRGPIADSDVPALYASWSVYCQPSREEGAGLSAMEAASYGANVIATSVGGIREHLGPSACYVAPSSTNEIVDAVRTAWETPLTGGVGRFVIEERNWAASVAEMMSAYELAGAVRRARSN